MAFSVDYFFNVTVRQLPFYYKRYKKYKGKIKVVGIIRARNESLIIKDTLDHMKKHVDQVVFLDDCSNDDTAEIAKKHPLVCEVLVNRNWKKKKRIWEETSNRKKLLSVAKKYDPDWIFYFDADERYEGKIKDFLHTGCPSSIDAIKISLFDAYITQDDKKTYKSNEKLYNYRKKFGPEVRDIVMIWRNKKQIDFLIPDAREPQGIENNKIVNKFFCQHYGKSISIEHWEETCDYYVKYFPKYRDKWEKRKGKAVHTVSDFGNKLYSWSEVKQKAVPMKRYQQK